MKKMKIDHSEAGALVLHNVNSDTYFLGTEDDVREHILKVGSLKAFAEEILERGFEGTADYQVEDDKIKFYPA